MLSSDKAGRGLFCHPLEYWSENTPTYPISNGSLDTILLYSKRRSLGPMEKPLYFNQLSYELPSISPYRFPWGTFRRSKELSANIGRLKYGVVWHSVDHFLHVGKLVLKKWMIWYNEYVLT